MYCKNCGQQIDDNAYVCIHCGVRTSDPIMPKKSGEVKYCAHCGEQIDPNAYICVHCGVKTGFVASQKKGNSSYAFAIISIMLSILFSVTFLGALCAVFGMSIAIDRQDKKGEKLNFVAMMICIAVSVLTIIINLLIRRYV